MECNKDEAIKAKELAESKMQNNEFEGAHKIAMKAQRLYPELDNINQLLAVCSVHCSARTNMLGLDKDWYGILQVDRLADEVTIKKQYRKLALVLHPDKNKFPGAEAAFKLIGEANLVLSDKTKRSIYDNKHKSSVRGGPSVKPRPPYPVNPPAPRSNFESNGLNNQFTAPNHHQKAQTTSSVDEISFWTSCPFCSVRYQYRREIVCRAVRCQNCAKPFIAYDIGSHSISTGFGARQPSQQTYKQKVVQNQGSAKPTANPSAVPQYPHQQAGTQRGNASQVFKDLRSKEKLKVNESPQDSRVKSKKRGRKHCASESSESCYSTSNDESEDFDIEEKERSPSGVQRVGVKHDNVRRSFRRRQDVSYNETEDDDFHSKHSKSVPYTEDVAPPESLHKGNTDADDATGSTSNGSKKVEVIIDCESDSDLNNVDDSVQTYTYPDPEFHDFDKDKEESCFAADQLWACYDTADGMPRFYAHIKKIYSPEFAIQFNWLEIHPHDKLVNDWADAELPVACGKFKRCRKSEIVYDRVSFSHRVQWAKDRKGAYIIYPRKGEIWALFRGWDIGWSSQPEKHQHFNYEVVEVLSDYVDDVGIRVGYLNKLDGYVSLFQGGTDLSGSSFFIKQNEIYRFSHRIPSFRLSGTEREGVPAGAFELDLASLPENPDDLWYPLKGMVSRSSKPRTPSKVGTCSSSIDPKEVNVVEDFEMAKAGKSPRPINVTEKK
ncbi:unnamed protein product [Cuscuta europaea]|uniref:J domain-containing protein n=1 Tax=Cuscuta europaea TaxID=41803 RepID=A0A9P1ECV0_CUSEU|nr:unnamed protein product [Cuscuta europaea]